MHGACRKCAIFVRFSQASDWPAACLLLSEKRGKCCLFTGLRVKVIVQTIPEWARFCGSRTYPYHPHRRDLPYDPPPLWIFQNWPPKCTLPSPPEFSKFSHTPSNCCYISYWSEQISSFVHWDANFVSFMYFLLNSITDKRIPDANSLCALVMNKFCEFHVFSVEFYNRQVNSLCA